MAKLERSICTESTSAPLYRRSFVAEINGVRCDNSRDTRRDKRNNISEVFRESIRSRSFISRFRNFRIHISFSANFRRGAERATISRYRNLRRAINLRRDRPLLQAPTSGWEKRKNSREMNITRFLFHFKKKSNRQHKKRACTIFSSKVKKIQSLFQ